MSPTKLLFAIFLSLLAPILAFTQTSSTLASLKLLPAPKEVDVKENLGDQGYVLSANLSRITVAGATGQGLFYGARLEDLRDATTRHRGIYEKAWLRENRPYWLGNVLVRYDLLAQTLQGKIVAVRDAQRRYWMQKTLPPPQQFGFYLQP